LIPGANFSAKPFNILFATLFLYAHADLDLGNEVPYADIRNITPLSFYRDFVSRNKPVIIRGCQSFFVSSSVTLTAFLSASRMCENA
jgi:hypothetical protein